MSTRANVVIRDHHTTLYFYRHSDGYPECTGEDIKLFVQGYKSTLRMDAMQSAGWLVIQGYLDPSYSDRSKGYEWKVGAYEPTERLHGDAEYVYLIDLVNKNLQAYVPRDEFFDNPTFENMRRLTDFDFPISSGDL